MANNVLVDACALAPRTIRDWLLLLRHLGSGSLFTVHYTEDILAETLKAIRRQQPHLEGSVLTGHGQDEEAITDVYDRHVHAAATDGGMTILVSADHHFLELPEDVKDTFEYEIYHPDDFFLLVDDADPARVRSVLVYQIDYRTQNGQPDYDFAERLRRSDCPQFADRVTQHLQDMAHDR